LTVSARRALAFQQHQLAYALETEVRERGITKAAAAAEMGVPAGTLGKKLRGHDPMYAEDLFAWILYLDKVELWPAPANLNELLP
jgi:predicted transcriptional regulator